MSITEHPPPDAPPAGNPPAGHPGRAPAAPPRRRNVLARYARWLHTQWPAGTVEKLPVVHDDGSTNVPGLYIVGDLTGIPLLKFSSDTGAKAVRAIVKRRTPGDGAATEGQDAPLDLIIIGGGVSGMAAALEARKHHLRFEILESAEPFATIINFPKGKPIYTYPTDMTPAGDLQFRADVKEALLDELRARTLAQGIIPRIAHVEKVTRARGCLEVHIAPAPGQGEAPSRIFARHVIVAIGRSGNHRKINVPGEDKPKVYNRLHDPGDFAGQNVLVVGGGDSAVETAVALAESAAHVTLAHRGPELSRPKPGNVERLNHLLSATGAVGDADPDQLPDLEKPTSEHVTPAVGGYMDGRRRPGSLRVLLNTHVQEIRDHDMILANGQRTSDNGQLTLPNDAVFTMIGREPPLDFLRRSGVKIAGDRGPAWWLTLVLALSICVFLYHWKKGGLEPGSVPGFGRIIALGNTAAEQKWFPYNFAEWLQATPAFQNPGNVLGTLRVSLGDPGFYYSLAYTLAVTLFGLRRIRRRRTPYVTAQTCALIAVQVIPLFLLPYLLLPWAGHNGLFSSGLGKTIADALFPVATYTEHGREYWRAFGLVLAWPLFFWNVFTSQPMWTWLAISFVQTFVIIPAIVYYWGKGAYCGWICSCGALAETMGDAHRHKMPHGPAWNRLNLLGQVFLAFAFVLLILRSLAWAWPNSFAGQWFDYLFKQLPYLNYVWFVDLLWAGILGVGLYWHFSGRVWCRFACPLAALMHVYHRFSRFRILADKKRCISCNVCTSVCHQGIDVMNFANKGLPMADPQCVRCSACVQSCPTGVLSFGQVDPGTGVTLKTDRLPASRVQMVELRHNGKPVARRQPEHT